MKIILGKENHLLITQTKNHKKKGTLHSTEVLNELTGGKRRD